MWGTFEMRLLAMVSSADPGLRWGGTWDHRRCGTCFCRLQMPQMLRGSFDQALWSQAFVVRAFQPAVCLHSHLLLGRSSPPFASLQMPKMLRGSWHQALFKPVISLAAASTRHSGYRHLLLEQSSLPFASIALCCYGVQACCLPAL
jgi:hypothetical protein